MIKYKNVKIYENIDFSDYLEHTGLSNSYLKREINGINPYLEITDNIRLGSLVDAILTDNGKVNMKDPLFDSAIKICKKIKNTFFGSLIEHLEKQISFTCDIEYNGFEIPSKGRLDYLLKNHAVIDLKVTKSKDLKGLINFMGYENQVWHYSKALNVPSSYLIIHSVPLDKTELIEIDVKSDYNDFYAEKIVKFGKLI